MRATANDLTAELEELRHRGLIRLVGRGTRVCAVLTPKGDHELRAWLLRS